MRQPAAEAEYLQGRQVSFTGRLASLTRAEAEALVLARGGEVTRSVGRRTSLLVVGQEGWPLRPDGGLTPKLRKAHKLQASGSPLVILPEEEWLNKLGLGPEACDIHRLYTTAQLY